MRGGSVELTAANIALRGTILRGLVGSTVHGVYLEGSDDRDEMGVCIEPPEYVIGLNRFEHYVYRTQPEGVRSGPGDLDLTIYSLRKWSRLALKGNPTILLLLFVPEEHLVVCTEAGRRLRANTELFASRAAAEPFIGYLNTQKERLIGIRGQLRVTRQELVDRHGYDTKYAMHMLRLGYQGQEYLSSGRISLPMPGGPREFLMQVRRGEVPLSDVLATAETLETELRALSHSSPLPERPDDSAVNRLLVDLYREAWDAEAFGAE